MDLDIKKLELSPRSITILEEARKEFSEKGYHKASVDTIAFNANVGKGTIYRHFGNKSSLFMIVLKHYFSVFHQDLVQDYKNLSFREVLEKIFSIYTENAFENKDFFPLLIHMISKFCEKSEEKSELASHIMIEIDYFKEIAQYGIEKGDIDASYNASDIAVILWENISSIIRKVIFIGYSREKVNRHNNLVLDILLKGLKKES